MYSIMLFEDGRKSSQIGGSLRTIAEVAAQIESLKADHDMVELDGYVGLKWERGGITCALIAVDEFGSPLKTSQI